MGSVISLHHALAEDFKGSLQELGIARFDVLARAGAYGRRPARIVGVQKLLIGQQEYLAQQKMTQFSYPPLYRAVMEDAMVAGQGTVVTRNGCLIRESATEFVATGRTPDGFTQAGAAEFEIKAPVTRHIETPSLLVKRPWWSNYGHWLTDGAALLALISAVKMPPNWQIVIAPQRTAAMRKVVGDSLEILAPGVPVIEHDDDECWSFSSLHYITPVHVPPSFKYPGAMAALRALMLHGAPPSDISPRIFVARGSPKSRILTNESEIIEICQSRGFQVIHPEQYDVQQQARIFHNAEIVIGVKGAAMANLLFAPASTGVIVLSPADFGGAFFWDIAGQASMDYVEIFGDLASADLPRTHNPFQIDPATLVAEIDALIARQAQGRPPTGVVIAPR